MQRMRSQARMQEGAGQGVQRGEPKTFDALQQKCK